MVRRAMLVPPDPSPKPRHAGECKDFMKKYLDCLRKNGSNSSPCRHLNKDYLECRMSRCVGPTSSRCAFLTCLRSGLMERDEWTNLGLSGVGELGSSTVAKDNPKDRPKA